MRLDAERAIVDFMRGNFHSLVEFANECGFDVGEDSLLLVCGTTKAPSCITATYSGFAQGIQGSVSGGVGPLASANLSVTIGNQVQSPTFQRAAPRPIPVRGSATLPGPAQPIPLSMQPSEAVRSSPGASSSGLTSNAPPGMCLFMNYFKLKRRMGWFKIPMRAAAGAHRLPFHPSGRGPSAPRVPMQATPSLPVGNVHGGSSYQDSGASFEREYSEEDRTVRGCRISAELSDH